MFVCRGSSYRSPLATTSRLDSDMKLPILVLAKSFVVEFPDAG